MKQAPHVGRSSHRRLQQKLLTAVARLRLRGFHIEAGVVNKDRAVVPRFAASRWYQLRVCLAKAAAESVSPDRVAIKASARTVSAIHDKVDANGSCRDPLHADIICDEDDVVREAEVSIVLKAVA